MHRISVWRRQGREGGKEGGMHRGWAPARQAEVCLWSRQHVLPRDAGPRQHLQLPAAAPGAAALHRYRPSQQSCPKGHAKSLSAPEGASLHSSSLLALQDLTYIYIFKFFLPAPVLSNWLLLQRSPRTGGGSRLWHWEIWQQKLMLLNIRDLLKKKDKMPFKGLGSLKERFFNPGKEEVKNTISDSLGNLRR